MYYRLTVDFAMNEYVFALWNPISLIPLINVAKDVDEEFDT